MDGAPAPRRGRHVRRPGGASTVAVSSPRRRSRGLAGPFLSLVSGRLGAAALQAITLVLLVRQVPPRDFALAAGVLGALALVSAVADLGITTALTRERARGAGPATQAGLLRVNRQAAAAAGVLTAAVLCAWSLVESDVRPLELLPLAAWVMLERAAEVRLAVAVADGHSGAAALNLLARRCVAPLALGLVLLVGGGSPLLALAVGYAAGAGLSLLLGLLFGVPLPSRPPPGASSPDLRATLRTAFPFWVNSVSAQSRQLDVLVVGLLGGGGAAAVYAAPARLIGPLRLLPTTFAQALLPHTAREGAVDPRAVGRSLGAVLAATAVLYGSLAAAAPWLLATGLGEQYRGSVTALRVLLAGLLVAGVSSSLTSLLQGSGREAAVAASNARNAGLALMAVAVGAWSGGGTGAAIGLVVGYLAQCAGLLRIAASRSAVTAP